MHLGDGVVANLGIGKRGIVLPDESFVARAEDVAVCAFRTGRLLFSKAEAQLTRNRSEGNGHNGLQVWKAGKAVLERNTFDDNSQNGIEVHGPGSTIKLKRNRCRGNAFYGIRFVSGAPGFKVGRDNELKKNRKGRVRMK